MSTNEQGHKTIPSAVEEPSGGGMVPRVMEKPMYDESVLDKKPEESHYSGIQNTNRPDRNPKIKRSGGRHSEKPVTTTRCISKDSRRTDSPSPLPRPRKKGGVCLKDWEKEPVNQPVLMSSGEVLKHKELMLKQEGVNKGKHHPRELANNIRKVRTVKEAIGNLGQEGRNQTPMKMISISLGHARKEILSHCGSSAARTEGWAMPTWCHMFNSTLTGNARVWFDKLPKESIDSYEDLRTAFRENYLQQTKHIKDPVEIHHIKQKDGESTEDFMERYKAEVLDVEGEVAALSHSGEAILHLGTIRRIWGQPTFKKLQKMQSRTVSQIDSHSSLKHQKKFSLWKRESSKLRPQWSPSQHNAIIGRPGIRKIRAVPSTAHGMLKFPVEGALVTFTDSSRSSHGMCYDLRILLHPDSCKKGRKELCVLLKQNLDIFAWKPADMTGVPRSIAEHRLNVREGYSPVRQKKRGQAPERNKAIQEEVEKLVDAWNNEGRGPTTKAEYEAPNAGLGSRAIGCKDLKQMLTQDLVANQGIFHQHKINEVKTRKLTPCRRCIPQAAHLNKQVLVEELKEKSINEKEILDVVQEEGNTWMTPIREYLTKEILPEDKKKARAVRRKAVRYAMINGTLYKKSFLGPWLRCVGPLQANYVLREIHEGSCSMHSGPRSVVAKAIQTGYYWPTMHMDARKLVRECNDCQVHRPVPRSPQQNLTPITSPWPFYKWGIDIAGPFPEGPQEKSLSEMEKQFRTIHSRLVRETLHPANALPL
ncbi:reverse transcriptase domain-containing protein [Tanacetum coccineum]